MLLFPAAVWIPPQPWSSQYDPLSLPMCSDVPSHDDVVDLFKKFDKDQNGKMNFEEYHEICKVRPIGCFFPVDRVIISWLWCFFLSPG